jgi:ADP-ribose pyrophosphatase
MSPPFERLERRTVWDGRIFSVEQERFRHADGEVVAREIARHQGAVAIVAYDEQHVWLVRQPREAVDEPALLEIPAGRRDREGEPPLATAQRELAEEIGRGAEHWQELVRYYSSAGFTDEQVIIFLAHGLYERTAQTEENERIEVVRWPLTRLQDAIDETRDAKTLIGLLMLAQRL